MLDPGLALLDQIDDRAIDRRVAAQEHDARIALGHTLDDQAETVLLGLARGSGARSLAGMPAVNGRYGKTSGGKASILDADTTLWLEDKPPGYRTRFVSDSFADAPLLQEADDAVFVTQSCKKRKRAESLGWHVIDGSR